MSKELLLALGEADANMYLCSKDLRPGQNRFSVLFCDKIGARNSSVRVLDL